jgi:hypothetical protein
MANPSEPPPPHVQALTLETYRALFEALPDAMVVVDDGGAIVLVNSHTERLLGYTRQELVGRPIETVIPVRLQTSHRTHRDRYVADPQTRSMVPASICARAARTGASSRWTSVSVR